MYIWENANGTQLSCQLLGEMLDEKENAHPQNINPKTDPSGQLNDTQQYL